jgi:hypothetical protein
MFHFSQSLPSSDDAGLTSRLCQGHKWNVPNFQLTGLLGIKKINLKITHVCSYHVIDISQIINNTAIEGMPEINTLHVHPPPLIIKSSAVLTSPVQGGY